MNDTPAEPQCSLAGLKVCMLVMNDARNDARVQKEARALADAGAQVSIVGVSVNGSAPWASDAFDVRLVEAQITNYSAVWPVRIVSNIAREFGVWRSMAEEATAVAPAVVHSHDLDTAWAGMLTARDCRAKLVYDAHELYTERSTIPWWRKWMFERIETRVLDRADLVLTANAERAEIMAKKYRVSREMVPLLNVPPTTSWVDEPSPAAIEARASIACERLLIYQGGFMRTRGLDAVVRAFESLPDGYHLALMGPGTVDAELLSEIDSTSLRGRVHLWDAVAPSEVPAWAAVADAGIVTYLPDSLNNTYCAPNKLYEYAAAGIPIVGADLPVIRRAITEHHAGVLFEPGDAKSFADAARRLLGNEAMVEDARRGVRELRQATNWEAEARKLVGAYERLSAEEPCEDASPRGST